MLKKLFVAILAAVGFAALDAAERIHLQLNVLNDPNAAFEVIGVSENVKANAKPHTFNNNPGRGQGFFVTLKDGTGAVQVPQGDVDAAAAEIVKLFSDGDLCARLGKAARLSYGEIAAFDQRGAYERLFADLGKPRNESSLLSVDSATAGNAVRVFAEHAQMGFATIRERVKKQIEAKDSRNDLMGSLGRLLMKVGRRLASP